MMLYSDYLTNLLSLLEVVLLLHFSITVNGLSRLYTELCAGGGGVVG